MAVAGACRQQLERLVEAVAQSLRPEQPQAGGGELERKRQAVQPPADLPDRVSVIGQAKARAHRLRARREERDGVVGRQRLQGIQRLVGDPQRRPARHHDPEPWTARHELGNIGRCGDDLLEVVQHEEHLPVADERDDAVRDRPFLGLLHVERSAESREEAVRFGHVGEPDEGGPVGELGKEPPAELGHEARLAHAAGPGDRHDAVPAREVGELGQLMFAAEQGRPRLRQRGADRDNGLALPLERSPVRNDEPGACDRVKVERLADVLEPEGSERSHVQVGLVLDLLVHRVREEDRAGNGERLDPRGDVHRIAREPLGLDDHLARVDADANRDLLRRELLLDRDGGLHSGERAREHAHAPVA